MDRRNVRRMPRADSGGSATDNGRLSGARLVSRQPARSIGAAKLRAPCLTFLRARRSLGISASDNLCRLRRRGRYRARSGRATVALRRGRDHEFARLARVYRAGRTPRVHDRFDARGRDGGRDAAARYGRRLGARPERSRARRRACEGRDRRRRRRRDRDGTVSILAARWLPLPAVPGYKGHSLVFETGGTIPAEALFLEYREASGEILTPELFPRADGTTWVCARRQGTDAQDRRRVEIGWTALRQDMPACSREWPSGTIGSDIHRHRSESAPCHPPCGFLG